MPKKKTTKKRKVGRPSKLETIDLAQVEKLAGYGLIDAQIADMLGIDERTLNRYKQDSEFCQTLKKGKVRADAEVTKSLYHRAIGYTINEGQGNEKHIPGDTTAMIYWLKNRRRDLWRDRHDLNHSGEVGGVQSVTITVVDDKGKPMSGDRPAE